MLELLQSRRLRIQFKVRRSNAIKQAAELGIVAGSQNLAGLLVYIPDVHAIGLEAAQGLILTWPFYWDLNEGTRAFAKRFNALMPKLEPSMIQAGDYAMTLHYLKAIATGGDVKDGRKVVDAMKKIPAEDPLFGQGSIRIDGRTIHNMYLFEVKKPSESKSSWDLYRLRATIPAAEAFRPLGEGGCPLVASASTGK